MSFSNDFNKTPFHIIDRAEPQLDFPKKLRHYSSALIEKFEDIEYPSEESSIYMLGMKPFGLWISVEDYEDDQNWKTWCEAERFRLHNLNYCYEVSLKTNANLLWLKNSLDISNFSIEYKRSIMPGPLSEGMVYSINWPQLIKQYDGIIIAPYCWEMRLSLLGCWYYGWDCASGCIWNMDCVEDIKLLYKQDPPYEYEEEKSFSELLSKESS